MGDKATSNIHWSFWLITGLLLVWNVLGCVNFFVQMNPQMLTSYRESEQAIVEGRPLWATVGFAVGVFGGAIGCVLLLLKRTMALYVFIASLLGVIDTMVYSLSIGIEFGVGEIVGIILMPLAVAGFLVWYSKYTENKGWLTRRS